MYLIFGACVQSHFELKEDIFVGNWLEFLVNQLKMEENDNTLRKLIYAISCLIRDHSKSQKVRIAPLRGHIENS